MKEYNLSAITQQIAQKIDRVSEDDWPTIAAKVSRFAAWEFEDYKAYS
ncbi:Imm8 family immunity protein [Paraburkholderia ginsengiterrae]|nr:Imm8 family immunity protein [Paraburkholderia ginsengiterrae]